VQLAAPKFAFIAGAARKFTKPKSVFTVSTQTGRLGRSCDTTEEQGKGDKPRFWDIFHIRFLKLVGEKRILK
jgi:hypothetical protein